MAYKYKRMTSQEFISWLKGYMEAIDGNNLSYKEYEKILEKLMSVKDE